MSQYKIGLIGGSGLADAVAASGREVIRHEVTTPFGSPSDVILETQWHGLPVLILPRHGGGHVYCPSRVPYRANIFALKQLGCTHIVASGAVGSLRDEYKPGDLVLVDQFIDKTIARQTSFFEKLVVHVEMAEPTCPVMRKSLLDASSDLSVRVHDHGCYVCMEGPAFSTRAESIMHRLWGGDLIGMTAMPEAKLAREAELPYCLIALVTDYDCWKSKPASVLEEVIGNLKMASNNALQLIDKALAKIAENPEALTNCPARDALKLAIWTEKSRVPGDEIEKLRPILGRYFSES